MDCSQEAIQAQQAQCDAKAQLKSIDKQLQPYAVKPGSGTRPTYTVDCFALDLQQEINGVRAYDHGIVFE